MNFVSFLFGTTRWVLLLGPVVIKIPRARPLFWVWHFLTIRKQGRVTEKLAGYHESLPIAAMKYFGKGILANLDEHRLSKELPDQPLAPTLFSFLGLLNVQLRGKPVGAYDERVCPFADLAKQYPQVEDFTKPEHFCRINDKIVLVDYGGLIGRILLEAYGKPAFALA